MIIDHFGGWLKIALLFFSSSMCVCTEWWVWIENETMILKVEGMRANREASQVHILSVIIEDYSVEWIGKKRQYIWMKPSAQLQQMARKKCGNAKIAEHFDTLRRRARAKWYANEWMNISFISLGWIATASGVAWEKEINGWRILK